MTPNTHPHAPTLTSAVCVAGAQGEGGWLSRTGSAVHILLPPYPSFGHSGRGRREREGGREGEQAGWEGRIEGGDKEGYERKCVCV